MKTSVLNEVRDAALSELEAFYYRKEKELNSGGVYLVVSDRTDLDNYERFRQAVTREFVPSVERPHPMTLGSMMDATRLNIPVSDKHSEFCPYADPMSNIRLRFWHDHLHYSLLYDFSYESELEVAQYMLEEGEKAGLSSLALCILYAEMVGQVEYHRRRKSFPTNQAAFIDSCVRHGVPVACMAVH